jgi:hypothetical protein
MVVERLGPVARSLREQLGERGARLDPLGRELDRAPIGEHRGLEILERTREQPAELFVHVGERGIAAGRMALRERGERRRRLAPLSEAAQQARLRECSRRAARIALRGDSEAQRRLAPLALLLERAPLEVRECRERGRLGM